MREKDLLSSFIETGAPARAGVPLLPPPLKGGDRVSIRHRRRERQHLPGPVQAVLAGRGAQGPKVKKLL